MTTVTLAIEQSRKELLDFTRRNRMTNYRRPTQSRGGIEIIDERPEEIYRMLAEEGKKMTFLSTTEYTNGQPTLLLASPDNEEAEDLDTSVVAPRHIDSKLQTALTQELLDRRLKRSYAKARTFIEEQGVNALFLAIGMLRWYEAESSLDVREGPLLLIPVELVRDSVRSRYKLHYTGDDIGFNISLREQLSREFSIELPSWPEEQELDVMAYFKMVSDAVAVKRRWSVETDALVVDFFSFSKLQMYQDLDANTWANVFEIESHHVLSKLLGSGSFLNEALIAGQDYSNEKEERAFATEGQLKHLVVDADSSQERAVGAVIAGKNLIIQGPPGTGKSQTITNIVAEAIGRGKKVLFVAEKMAALQVVKRRLDNLGLGDVCLELHSNKSNKRVFLTELERTLQLGEPHTKSQEYTAQSVEKERAHLDEYCRLINSESGDAGLTLYEAYGAYLKADRRLSEAKPPQLSIPDADIWSEADFLERMEIVHRLQALLGKMGSPKEHPFWGSSRRRFLPTDQQALENACVAAEQSVDELRSAVHRAATIFSLPLAENRDFAKACLRVVELALDAPNMKGLSSRVDEWKLYLPNIVETIAVGRSLARNSELYGEYFVAEIVQEDVATVRKAIMTHGDRLSRFWSRDYRNGQKVLRGVGRIDVPKERDLQIKLVDAVLEVQRLTPKLEANQSLMRQMFEHCWSEMNPVWEILNEIALWCKRTFDSGLAEALLEKLFSYVTEGLDRGDLAALRVSLQSALDAHEHTLMDVKQVIELDDKVRFENRQHLLTMSFNEQASLLRTCALEAARLQEFVSYNAAVTELKERGLVCVVYIVETWEYASSRLADLIRRSRYASVVERAMNEHPLLASFDGATHGHRITRFREMDQLLLQQSRSSILHEHWRNLPRRHAGGVALLHEQFNRKRGHKSIRMLMSKAGPTIQAIKPIFMMSPFSIATFLPAGSVEFDLVVFDEASQVRPVDALGAILRGKQTIVVGDDKQMPPTNFFAKVLDESSDDNVVADTESILGLFRAKAAQQEMLEWHYRSRHESLIAVSNHEFYNNRLIVFPSPDKERKQLGLVYHHHPETRYKRRTDGSGGGHNIEEAQIVADAVMSHARNHPNKSLLVATFNQQQREVIEDLIEKQRQNDSSGESFFNGNPDEPFAIKNLENVQGDERDVIYISIGFGRDQDNKIAMNFGPLNRDGGERRLNVLITRARERCEVFANITADDIDLNRTKARGVRALKRFLKYAQTGILDLPEGTGNEVDSPFEQAVVDALRDEGYEVEIQIGTGGYRIDLAIVDDKQPGRYLIGIECDGATYHSAKSARDRDRLRQEVLEGIGWQVHRIWSTDWFRNPQREIQRVKESVEKARARYAVVEQQAPGTSANGSSQTSELAIERLTSTLPQDLRLPEYKVAVPQLIISADDYEFMAKERVEREMIRVVEIEAPIHIEQLFQRLSTRVSKNIRQYLEEILHDVIRDGKVFRNGDHCMICNDEPIMIRDRSKLAGSVKKVEHVYPLELQEAVLNVVTSVHIIVRGELGREALRLLGYTRMTENMASIIDSVINEMLTDGSLCMSGENVVVG